MSDRPEMKQAPGSRDSELPWVPPHVEPTKHDDPKLPRPSVQEDLGPHTPGQLGGEPSTGWSTEE
jgi:hypothetical protein